MDSTGGLPQLKHWGRALVGLGLRFLEAICLWRRTRNLRQNQRQDDEPSPISLDIPTRGPGVDYRIVPFLDPSPAIDPGLVTSPQVLTARYLIEGY